MLSVNRLDAWLFIASRAFCSPLAVFIQIQVRFFLLFSVLFFHGNWRVQIEFHCLHNGCGVDLRIMIRFVSAKKSSNCGVLFIYFFKILNYSENFTFD